MILDNIYAITIQDTRDSSLTFAPTENFSLPTVVATTMKPDEVFVWQTLMDIYG